MQGFPPFFLYQLDVGVEPLCPLLASEVIVISIVPRSAERSIYGPFSPVQITMAAGFSKGN